MLKKIVGFLLGSFASLFIYGGIPYPTVTTLDAPPPGMIDPKDFPLLGTILGLSLYQDSEDSNVYYYVPPFRILQFDQGAAGMLLHTVKAENIYQADNLMKKMQSEELVPPEHIVNGPVVALKRESLERDIEYIEKTKERFENEIKEINNEIKELKQNLALAVKEDQKNLIEHFRESLAGRQEELFVLKSQASEIIEKEEQQIYESECKLKSYIADSVEKWRQEKMRTRLWPVVTYLASAGKSIPMSQYPNTEDLATVINSTIDELKQSYGGSLSVNIYSGFTEKQIHDITYLRDKYWPHVRIVLMESEDLQFVSLAEVEDSDGHVRKNAMFKGMKGSGSYQGATINFDLTIDGATSLALALGPFIVPVGITANITEKMLPFEAEFRCNFADTIMPNINVIERNGKLIFSTEDMVTGINDTKNSTCNVTMLKGDESSAHALALKELEKEFDNINVTKTKLSQNESKRYLTRVLKDFEQQKDKTKSIKKWQDYIPLIGTGADAVKILSGFNDDYWQTPASNLEKFNKLNFTKKISYHGHQMVRKSMPTSLCLFYNAKKKAYDRCTKALEEMAQNPVEATKLAKSSGSCEGFEKIKDCFDKRLAEAPELWPEDEAETEGEDNNLLELH
jgi:hypothetical protein